MFWGLHRPSTKDFVRVHIVRLHQQCMRPVTLIIVFLMVTILTFVHIVRLHQQCMRPVTLIIVFFDGNNTYSLEVGRTSLLEHGM